ncbi:MAG: BLUF domain-containing protein [Micropepsaceae bacterium]
MIRQVVYLSTARNPGSDADLTAILDTARAKNGDKGITGLLAHGGTLFLQILEGAPAAIEALMAKIAADDRHRSVRVLQDIMVDERSFCGTTMAFRTLDPDAAHLIAARARNGAMPACTIAAVLGDAREAAFGAQVLKAA